MISNLVRPGFAFQAGEMTSARDAYSARMKENSQIAQKQNNVVSNPVVKNAQTVNAQISMQGAQQGQKLDIIA